MIKLKNFWKKYEPKIVLILGFILIAIISFEAGIVKGREIKQNPIIIEKPVNNNSVCQNTPEAQNSAPSDLKTSDGINTQSQNCAFVGSKNSNKYHLPTCRWAKQIKPENIVCFSSEEDAKSKGYLPDKNCIK